MVRTGYLTQQEKAGTIPLWKEAFPEDGPGFLGYYYKEKTRDNRILAAWEEEPKEQHNPTGNQGQEQAGSRRILSMIHRNPYRLWIHGRVIDSDYIVAVATAKDRRHQGLMRMLMNQMLEDMHREGMPFCYLMPADRRIYEPFQFAYIYDQEHWSLKEEAERQLKKEQAGLKEAKKAARWMEGWLEERYGVFAVRDRNYVKCLMAELESEAGWMEFLFQEKTDSTPEDGEGCPGISPAGIRCWWGLEKREQRMLLCKEEYRETRKERTPAIMARITELTKCLELVHLKRDSSLDEMELILQVEDKQCPWNDGSFLWRIGKERSKAVKLEEPCEAASPGILCLPMEIGTLTQRIFGYGQPKEPEDVWQDIDTWKDVFLDEIV